jgi:hypothetical protein
VATEVTPNSALQATLASGLRPWALVCAITFVATSALGQKPGPAGARSDLFADLITLTEFPSTESMTELEIPVQDPSLPAPLARSRCFAKEPKLDAAILRELLTEARPVSADNPSIRQWHYSPWCNVAFRVRGERYTAQLFLGGRGFLNEPNGKRGMFSYTYPGLAPP